MAHKLTMRFITEQEGKYYSITIDNIKVDLETGMPAVTEEEVNSLMNLIIQKNVFMSNYGAVVGKKDAKVVSTTMQEFQLV